MEAKNFAGKRTGAVQRESVKTAAVNILYMLCGMLVSKGAVFGELAPFGASFAAAVPKKYLFSSLVGVGFGYILLNPSDSFRYIAAVIAIGLLRWLFADFKNISSSKVFAPLVAFVPIFATGLALLFVSTSTLSSFSNCVTEAVIAGAAAYFIGVAAKLAGDARRSVATYTQQETASVVLTGCVLILAFGSVTYENVSVGRILAVIIVLLCSRYGGVTGGAISGIATGSIFSIADRNMGFICGGYSFGGLISGLFAPLGKIGGAISFLAADLVMSLSFSQSDSMAGVLIEALIGTGLFLIIPNSVGDFISPVFSNESGASIGETLRRNAVMRLDFASKAIFNVRRDVEKVSEKMQKLYAPTFERVCENTAEDVCSGCGLRVYCYENQSGVTYDDFHRLEEILEKNGKVLQEDINKIFVKKCCKAGELADSMNKNYENFLAGTQAQRRVAEMRGVVAGQFAGVSDILSDLAKDFKATMKYDVSSAEKIAAAVSELGAAPIECVCPVSDGGRMSVELEISDKINGKISRGTIAREVSRCCGRRFDLPSISKEGSRIRLALCELPIYDVEIGSHQHIANHGKLCGDCIDYFNDGFGKCYAVICDGMGTGGRAAVDGNMAASVMGRLLRSGLSPDSSLQIVNSALMIKSEDESISTLDITCVDLYTGRVTLRKAGAPLTLIKKNGRVITREMPSLPAGILNNIKFTTDSLNLSTGDMVVMVSDGVTGADEKWLEKLIKSWNKGSAQDLARAVVEESLKHRREKREDDITAIAMKITDNEV